MASVTLQNVTKIYRGRRGEEIPAVLDLSLEVPDKSFVVLLGPSGCGKTSTLRMVAGLESLTSGRILIGDTDVSELPPGDRDVTMVFQNYSLYPHLSVAENLAFGLRVRHLPADDIARRVHEAAAILGIEDILTRMPRDLSGGQQQRVAVGRAIVRQPRVFLFDEPLSNLDAKLRLEMRGEIRRICKDAGLTAIYVTHDQKEALSMADRMAVLEAGRLAQVGTPEELYRRPANAFVAGFVGETNLIPGTAAFVSGENHYVRTAFGDLAGRVVAPDWKPQPGEAVTLSIRPECLSLSPTPPLQNGIAGTLEDSVYLGEIAQYTLRPAGQEAPLHLSELNPRRILRDTGTTFYASAKPEDIVVLPGNR
jgi:iron(III) transport system ATP-binding protein